MKLIKLRLSAPRRAPMRSTSVVLEGAARNIRAPMGRPSETAIVRALILQMTGALASLLGCHIAIVEYCEPHVRRWT